MDRVEELACTYPRKDNALNATESATRDHRLEAARVGEGGRNKLGRRDGGSVGVAVLPIGVHLILVVAAAAVLHLRRRLRQHSLQFGLRVHCRWRLAARHFY